MTTHSKVLAGAMVLIGSVSGCGQALPPPPPGEGGVGGSTTHRAEALWRPCVVPPPPRIRARNEVGEEFTDEEMRGETMVRPRLIAGEEMPIFSPGQIIANRNHSTLLLARCTIHIDGTVSHCTMICSNPMLEESVLSNLKARRYSPALFRGRPVEIPYVFTFRIIGQ